MNRSLNLFSLVSLITAGCAVETEAAEGDASDVEVVDAIVSDEAQFDAVDGKPDAQAGGKMSEGLDLGKVVDSAQGLPSADVGEDIEDGLELGEEIDAAEGINADAGVKVAAGLVAPGGLAIGGVAVHGGGPVIPKGPAVVGAAHGPNGQCKFGEMLIIEVPLPTPVDGWPADWTVEGGREDYCVKAKNVRNWIVDNYECGYHYEIHPIPADVTIDTMKQLEGECADEMRASQE